MSHIPRILVDLPLAVGEQLALPGDKAHHLNTVLRLGKGAQLRLFNGNGKEHTATITHAARNTVEVAIDDAHAPQRESPVDVTLAQGIVRGDRMDFAIAKAVELGVHEIRPLFSKRGKVRLDDARLHKKQTHWQRVAESAAEQSGRLVRPRVEAACTLAQFLEAPPDGLRLVLAPEAGTGLAQLQFKHRATLLVGPESGLSDTETTAAIDAGFTALRLGPRVLRTETAGMAALAAIQSRWGDL